MTQTIEHIVLFKVKENTDPAKIAIMVNGLNSLISLDQVVYLSTGAVHKTLSTSPSFNYTHMLHSRYKTKEDLNTFLMDPKHLNLVAESVDPLCDDIMIVDWVADDVDGPLVLPSGAVIRVNFFKLKEGLEESKKEEALKVLGGVRDHFGLIKQLTCGENFSPMRSNGFSIASLALVPKLEVLKALDSHKEKVEAHLESFISVDYVVG